MSTCIWASDTIYVCLPCQKLNCWYRIGKNFCRGYLTMLCRLWPYKIAAIVATAVAITPSQRYNTLPKTFFLCFTHHFLLIFFSFSLSHTLPTRFHFYLLFWFVSPHVKIVIPWKLQLNIRMQVHVSVLFFFFHSFLFSFNTFSVCHQ